MSDIAHTRPPWAVATDWNHRAWPSFMERMRRDGERPTSALWTLWHAAYLHGETDQMEQRFRQTSESLALLDKLAKKEVQW